MRSWQSWRSTAAPTARRGSSSERGQEPVAGVPAPIGIRCLGRSARREDLSDSGGDAVARPGRRCGLAPACGGPVVDGRARGAFVRSAVRRVVGGPAGIGHRFPAGDPADRQRVGGHRAGNRPPRRPADRRRKPRALAGLTRPDVQPVITSTGGHRAGLGLAGRSRSSAGPTPGRVATLRRPVRLIRARPAALRRRAARVRRAGAHRPPRPVWPDLSGVGWVELAGIIWRGAPGNCCSARTSPAASSADSPNA